MKKRKSKIKSENDEEIPEYKIKKDESLAPSTSICLDYSPPPSSSSPSSDCQIQIQSPIRSIKKEDIWYTIEDGGEILRSKDLLPAGMIKNSSKLRFDVKEISLAEEI